jgi:ketol-acid reductoisomerase
MTRIFHQDDADPTCLDGATIAVVGYGNQGRSWALNLRDSGADVRVHARADESREQAERDGFTVGRIEDAGDADVICVLVPDDVIPELPIAPRDGALLVVASGYTPAFGRLQLTCDIGMVAPRMLGPEVRRCYEEGVGFISAIGVQQDVTDTALARTLAIASMIGALRQGAIEMAPMQEAVLDLAVEQALAPALRQVSQSFVEVMLEHGIPLEAILCELFLSGEVERTYRLLRLEGYAAQMEHHSPTSQYGQLSRVPRFEPMDPRPLMREVVDEIATGRFADEWDAERDAGHPTLQRLKAEALPPEMTEWERELRGELGELVARRPAPQ